jgi:hypothetical protein
MGEGANGRVGEKNRIGTLFLRSTLQKPQA